ncbi:RNA ligase family protein [Paenibacillus sp. NPDC057967]|uniref:RNA ligase family protein n=1 Tax=Paenibacillus sp. NPDC057967 TaxID=3346293 RepID=UPI0036D83062
MSVEQRKYTDIIRLGHRDSAGVVVEGSYITVFEKLDGANASFRDGSGLPVDAFVEGVVAYSRNTRLSPENNLRGFYEWTQQLDRTNLLPDTIYYGEWLVKHKVDYGQHAGTFYLFDIYNEEDGCYAPTDFVIAEAARLGLAVAPILYAGPYVSFEHLTSLVGRSAIASAADGGEGIVVKNVNFRDRFGRQTFVKLVSDSFREMQPQKAPRDPNTETPETTFVKTYLTQGRVDKLTHKLVDETVIPEAFGLEDMGVILRELGPRAYDDLLKEEAAELPVSHEEKAIRRAIGKILPMLVKAVISEKEAV